MKTLHTRKSWTWLLALMLALSMALSACGGGGGNKGGNAGGDSGGGSGGSGGNGGGSSGKRVVVDFWATQMEDFTTKWWERWIEEFNNTNDRIEINFEVIPGDAWDQRMTAAQAAGTAPDIYTMNYNKIAFSADQGKIQALDEYVDASVWEDLFDNVEGFVSVAGKHYAYPLLVEPSSILYYRKDFFEEAGLDPNKPPVTWDELIEYGKKLATNGRYGLLAAGNAVEIAWTNWGWQGMVGQFPISDDWSKATINNDAYRKLLQFWKDLHANGVVPKQMPGGYTDILPFGEGRAAMAINGSWAIGQLRNDFPDILDKVGVAVMPTPDGNQQVPTASLGGWTLVVDGNSDHPKEAAEFITWMLAGNPDIMIDFFKTTKYSKFPARKSVDEAINADPEAQNDEWRKLVAEKVVPYAVGEPIYAWEISMAYATAVERVVLQGMDIDKSLEIAEKEINDYIEANNYAGTNPNLQ